MAINAETVQYTLKGVFKDDITGKSDKAFKQFEKNGTKAMAGVVAAVALVGVAITAMTVKTVNSADQIGKQAIRFGLTTQALQEMRFAFDLAGVSISLADQSILVFGKRLGKARDGTGAMITGLEKLDKQLLVDLKNSDGMSDALDILFTRLEKAKGAAERLAIADAAFGRGGLQIVSAFAAGKDSFKGAREEAERLGVVLNDEIIQAAQDTKDEMTRMTTVIDTGLTIALSNLFPIINTVAGAVVEMGTAMRQAFGEAINPNALNLKELKSELQQLLDLQNSVRETGEGAFKGNQLFAPQGDNAEKANAAMNAKIANIRRLIAAREQQSEVEKNLKSSTSDLDDTGKALDDNMARLGKNATMANNSVASLKRELEILRDGEYMKRIGKETKDIGPEFVALRKEARALNAEIRELELRGARQATASQLQAEILSRVVVDPMEVSILKTQELIALASEFPDIITEAIVDSGMDQIQLELAEATEGMSRFEQAAVDAGEALAFTFEDAIIEAENFGEILFALAKDLQRIFLRNLVTEPLAEAGGSFLKSLIPAGLSFAGGSSGAGGGQINSGSSAFFGANSRHGNVFDGGSLIPFRVGGIVSRPGAFRLGAGIGTIAEETPEAILPLKRTSGGDLGVMSTPPEVNVEVNVINNTNSQVNTERSPQGNGDLRLDITIDEIVAEKIKSGGKTRAAIKETFALNERSVGR